MPNVNTLLQEPEKTRSALFLTVWHSTWTKGEKKKKSHLLISQDESKKYQPGNSGWETVSGTEKLGAYSFPILRTTLRRVWDFF